MAGPAGKNIENILVFDEYHVMEYVFLYRRNIKYYFIYLGGAPEELAAGGTNCGAKNFLTHNDFVNIDSEVEDNIHYPKRIDFQGKACKRENPH